ncbi:hypothetical protein [Nocardia xishanensis]
MTAPESSQSGSTRANPAPRSKPSNQIPAVLAVERILARTDDLAVALVGARVYRAGVELAIEIFTRRRRVPVPDMFGGGHPDAAKSQLLLGIGFADGRTATNVGRTWDGPAGAPVLSMGSASSTNTRATATFYLTPLPPPGPLSIVIAWPALDLAEHRVELDTENIRLAAERATILWPEGTEPVFCDKPPALPQLARGSWFESVLT